MIVATHDGGDAIIDPSARLSVSPAPDVTASGGNGTFTPGEEYRGDDRLVADDTIVLRYDSGTIEGETVVVGYTHREASVVLFEAQFQSGA